MAPTNKWLVKQLCFGENDVIYESPLIVGIVGGHSSGLYPAGRVLLEAGGRVFLLEQEDRIVWFGPLWNRCDNHRDRIFDRSGKPPRPRGGGAQIY